MNNHAKILDPALLIFMRYREKKHKNIGENRTKENVWIYITAKINSKKPEKEQTDPDRDLEQSSHGPSMASSTENAW